MTRLNVKKSKKDRDNARTKKDIRNISAGSFGRLLPVLCRQFTTPKWACLLSGRVLTRPGRPLCDKHA